MSIEFDAIAAAGGTSAVARALGVSVARVSNWKRRKSIPAQFCESIARLTHGRYTAHMLQPAVFRAEREAA